MNNGDAIRDLAYEQRIDNLTKLVADLQTELADEREAGLSCFQDKVRLEKILERIANHQTADSWECKPLATMAREALSYDGNAWIREKIAGFPPSGDEKL